MKGLIAVFAALCAGCSTYYSKPGATDDEFQKALYECERDFAAVQEPLLRSRQVDRCLAVKGWKRE